MGHAYGLCARKVPDPVICIKLIGTLSASDLWVKGFSRIVTAVGGRQLLLNLHRYGPRIADYKFLADLSHVDTSVRLVLVGIFARECLEPSRAQIYFIVIIHAFPSHSPEIAS